MQASFAVSPLVVHGRCCCAGDVWLCLPLVLGASSPEGGGPAGRNSAGLLTPLLPAPGDADGCMGQVGWWEAEEEEAKAFKGEDEDDVTKSTLVDEHGSDDDDDVVRRGIPLEGEA